MGLMDDEYGPLTTMGDEPVGQGQGVPIARIGKLDVGAGGEVAPAQGPTPSIMDRLTSFGGAVQQGLEAAAPMARRIGGALSGGIAAGRAGDPRAAIPIYAQAQQHEMMTALSSIDPTTPDGLSEAIKVLMRFGRVDLANGLIDSVQRGQIAQYRRNTELIKASMKAPTTRTVRGVDAQGQPEIINQEWDRGSGTWSEVGRGPATSPVQIDMGQQGVKNTLAIQKQYQKASEEWKTISDQYQRMEAAYGLWQEQGGGDAGSQTNPQIYQVMGMILSKMLDPTSVVRESEFARTEEFQSAIQRARGFMTKWQTGNVDPQLIRDVYEIGGVLEQAARATQQEVTQGFTRWAESEGLNPDFIKLGVPEPGGSPAQGMSPAQRPGPTADQLDRVLMSFDIDPDTATEEQLQAAYDALSSGE